MDNTIKLLLIIFLLNFPFERLTAQPINDKYKDAIILTNTMQCSAESAYTTVAANDELLIPKPISWTSGIALKDVWFKFTAQASGLSISIMGANTGGGSTGGTITKPLIALYILDSNGTTLTDIASTNSFKPGEKVSSYKKSDLELGKEYYIRISSASGPGTFQICLRNFFEYDEAGNDYSGAVHLCNKNSFVQHHVEMSGADNQEAYGSCITREYHTAWYKWVAANDGTLTMDITPLVNTDDLDWVLYDLGTSGDFGNKLLLRCATGNGIINTDCPSEQLYFKTGMNLTSTDESELKGCGLSGQDGYLKFVNLQKGHIYALLIDNYTSVNNGFELSFGGTAEFEGPEAKINLLGTSFCIGSKDIALSSTINGTYKKLEWYFGEDASLKTSIDPIPIPISYSSTGYKTVSLRVYKDDNCFSTISQSFYVMPNPPKPIINGLKTSYCIGEKLNLSTPNESNASYQWNGPEGFTSNLREIEVLLDDPNKAGVYTVRIIKDNCSSDATEITVPIPTPLPKPSFTISTIDLCAINENFTFTNTSTDFTNVKWNFGDGANISDSNDENPPPIKYSTDGEKTISLEAFNKFGCSTIITKTFKIKKKPNKPIINGLQSNYCIGETIKLSTSALPGASYLWSGPNGFTASTNEIDVLIDAANKAGSYSLITTIDGCSSDPSTVIIPSIGQSPIASFTITSANLCTPSQTFTFTNNSLNFTKLRWDFGDGANIAPGSVNPINTVTYSSSGKKIISLEVEGGANCISIFKQEIEVSIGPSTPKITVNSPDYCKGESIKLSTEVQAGAVYSWTGPNGFASSEREPEIPYDSPAVIGTYYLSVSIGPCKSPTVNTILTSKNKEPIANFDTKPAMPFNLTAPFDVQFINKSTDSDSFLWDFGDGNTSTEENPTHTYLTDGDFVVSLSASRGSKCSDFIQKGINKMNNIGNLELFIPNAFTPNNDGQNDRFGIFIPNILSYKIQIFNRIGVSLFISDDINNHWDGTFNNEPLPIGSYYYNIKVVNINGDNLQFSGSVTILR